MLAKIVFYDVVLPKVGEKFYPIADFGDGTTKNWSFVVECMQILSSDMVEAEVYFLMEQAPKEYLKSGNAFKLYAGSKLIGSGKII